MGQADPCPGPVDGAEALVVHTLAMRRDDDVELDAEARRQGELFETKLNRYFRNLSREQYEWVCAWVGVESVAEELITELKVKCFEDEETPHGRDAARLPHVMAKWRDSARR